MNDYRALCVELFRACETLYKQSVTTCHFQTIKLSNGEHPIPLGNDILAQDAVFGYLLHRARAALAKHSSPKIDHFLGAISDEQIRNLAEFNFNFDRFNQVDQDKSETLAWECTDSDLIQFARFLISGGQKL